MPCGDRQCQGPSDQSIELVVSTGIARSPYLLLSAIISLCTGAMVLAGGFIWILPSIVFLAGLLLFLAGLALVGIVSARQARYEGATLLGAGWKALRSIWKWFWNLVP